MAQSAQNEAENDDGKAEAQDERCSVDGQRVEDRHLLAAVVGDGRELPEDKRRRYGQNAGEKTRKRHRGPVNEDQVDRHADDDGNHGVQYDGGELVTRERGAPQHGHEARAHAHEGAGDYGKGRARRLEPGSVNEQRAHARQAGGGYERVFPDVKFQQKLIGEGEQKQARAKREEERVEHDGQAVLGKNRGAREKGRGRENVAHAEDDEKDPGLEDAETHREGVEVARCVRIVLSVCDADGYMRKTLCHAGPLESSRRHTVVTTFSHNKTPSESRL